MKYVLLLLSVFSVSMLSACSEAEDALPHGDEQYQMSSASSVPPPPLDEEDLVTKNVTYTGILEQGGVTIYQEGSHRLMLADGKMVLLEPMEGSPKMLDLYNEKLVRVEGDVQPTMEAGGTLMRVKTIHWIRREQDADGVEQERLRVLCGGESGVQCPEGFSCALTEGGPGVCEEGSAISSFASSEISSSDSSVRSSSISSVSTSSSTSAAASSPSSSSVSSAASSTSTSASSAASGSFEQSVALMLGEDYAPERWTQEYCSAHVGFCVPVHKNWYYKSFGAMSSVLWHVEIGAVNVDQMGDGPLVVELKSGDLATLSLGDGDISVVGDKAIGYRNFTENRHFEISGPAELREPVEYATKNLSLVSGGG